MTSFTQILAIQDIALEILPYLALKDLFVLRCCCREVKNAVDSVCLPHLRNLVLTNNFVPPDFIFCLLPKCVRLRVLKLRGYLPMPDYLLSDLLENNYRTLRDVRIVNLKGFELGPSSFQPILLDKCRNLRTLEISHCPYITDGSLECFLLHINSNLLGQTTTFHSLRHLDLSHCNQISSKVLNLFLKCRFFQLSRLNLSGVVAVQDETLAAIASGETGKSLVSLNLTKCKGITDEGLR